jgi:hypothetical protein
VIGADAVAWSSPPALRGPPVLRMLVQEEGPLKPPTSLKAYSGGASGPSEAATATGTPGEAVRHLPRVPVKRSSKAEWSVLRPCGAALAVGGGSGDGDADGDGGAGARGGCDPRGRGARGRTTLRPPRTLPGLEAQAIVSAICWRSLGLVPRVVAYEVTRCCILLKDGAFRTASDTGLLCVCPV